MPQKSSISEISHELNVLKRLILDRGLPPENIGLSGRDWIKAGLGHNETHLLAHLLNEAVNKVV